MQTVPKPSELSPGTGTAWGCRCGLGAPNTCCGITSEPEWSRQCSPTPGNRSDGLGIHTDCPSQCWKEADLTLGTEQCVYYYPNGEGHVTKAEKEKQSKGDVVHCQTHYNYLLSTSLLFPVLLHYRAHTNNPSQGDNIHITRHASVYIHHHHMLHFTVHYQSNAPL